MLESMSYTYVRNTWGVPACTGRRVVVDGRPGVIAEPRDHYIGVSFDDDNPGVVKNCHPTSKVEYQGMGDVRRPTRSQERYQRFLEYGDGFGDFIDYCRWDAAPERIWNGGWG